MPKRNPIPPGIVASSVTPFTRDGALNLRAVKPHIEWLIGEGVAGLSPLGSAGEFFAMESADRKRVLDAVIEANAGRVPIMAGTHHYATRIAIDLSKHAERAGADALLIVPPYYGGPTRPAVMDHYRRIADAVSIPTVLYHNAAGTGVDLDTAQLKQLFDEKAIAAIKLSNLMPDRMVELMQATRGRMPVYAGIDYVAFEGLSHGAHGWISGIPSITPRAANELYVAISRNGDLKTARLLWAKLAPLMRFLFESHTRGGVGVHWCGVMKAALGMIGPDVGEPLPPSPPLNGAGRKRLAALLRDLGYRVRRS
ncbi:MAG: dihydrodipicolinate synthase family protein [Alphaproteobacteria bacterium]|nr:dihydrodipicolinate synthase family protein [Alphaproteobacteria bacterium]